MAPTVNHVRTLQGADLYFTKAGVEVTLSIMICHPGTVWIWAPPVDKAVHFPVQKGGFRIINHYKFIQRFVSKTTISKH